MSEDIGSSTAKDDHQADSMKYLPLFKAALEGDWTATERIISSDKSAAAAEIGEKTVLHAAMSTGLSNEFLRKLVDQMPEDLLGAGNVNGLTPLHYAAITGNTQGIKILVEKNKTLPQKRDNQNRTPLHYAAWFAQRESVCYLLQVTTDEDTSPLAGTLRVELLNCLINAEFYDIALDLLKRYPGLAMGKGFQDETILKTLAQKSTAFPSGTNMGCFQRLIYHFVMGGVVKRKISGRGQDVENPSGDLEDLTKESKYYGYGFFQQIYNRRLIHMQVMEILRLAISQVVRSCTYDEACHIVIPAVTLGIKLGVHELVAEILEAFPLVAWLAGPPDRRNILHLAVLHRQEKVFNLFCQKSLFKNFNTLYVDKFGNNLLHLAGMLNPSSKISGAALQMQRELQWFKEVEKLVPPSYKEMKNKDENTPRIVFSKEHKSLVEEGEKWMKSTAESCALVAALVVTVAFAAAFTAPGGQDDDGIPNHLTETSFLIFAISVILALFSSTTSLLTFLGILTSRYAEEDFLFALPMRLCIGLISLFLSIASMLVAFTSSMHILVSDRVNMSWVPIGVLALVPVTLFAILQFPLLVQIVYSTFGPSIFHQQTKDKIH